MSNRIAITFDSLPAPVLDNLPDAITECVADLAIEYGLDPDYAEELARECANAAEHMTDRAREGAE